MDADRCVGACSGVIRSSDMSLPLKLREPAPDPVGSPRNRLTSCVLPALVRVPGVVPSLRVTIQGSHPVVATCH